MLRCFTDCFEPTLNQKARSHDHHGVSAFPGQRKFQKTGGNALAAPGPLQANNYNFQPSAPPSDANEVISGKFLYYWKSTRC